MSYNEVGESSFLADFAEQRFIFWVNLNPKTNCKDKKI